jgi:hypothetical protein
VVHLELVRGRAEADRVDFVGALPVDPGGLEVVGEDADLKLAAVWVTLGAAVLRLPEPFVQEGVKRLGPNSLALRPFRGRWPTMAAATSQYLPRDRELQHQRAGFPAGQLATVHR